MLRRAVAAALFVLPLMVLVAPASVAQASPLLTIDAVAGSSFIPLNGDGIIFNSVGDPDVCLLTGASGCFNAFRDPIVFYFRNDTSQPVDRIQVGVGVAGFGGIELGFYSGSPGTVAPTSASQAAPSAEFFFSTPVQPGELTELLWVARIEGNLQPGGGQPFSMVAYDGLTIATSGGALTTPAVFVPEPTAALLLACGLVGLGVRQGLRSRS